MVSYLFTKKQSSAGSGLIEVMIGIAVLTTVVIGVVSSFQYMVRTSAETAHATQAQFLLEEGLEAMRIRRDDAWSNLSSLTPGTWYTLFWNGTTWTTSAGTISIDGIFDRRVKIDTVRRDGDDDIAASGTLDPNTYKVTASVSWNTGTASTTRTLSTYLTNIFE